MALPVILSYQTPRPKTFAWLRKAVLAFCVGGCLVSVFLWIAHSGLYYRPVHGPRVAIMLPCVEWNIATARDGIHFRVWRDGGMRWPHVSIPNSNGWTTYRHGYYVELLGFTAAWSPHRYNGGDYFIFPYAALVLPYWLIIMGLGWLSLRLSGLWGVLACYRRWSATSGIVAAALAALFIGLNFVPHDIGTPTRSLPPENVWEWLDVTFHPPGPYGDVRLSYGFPFTCLRQGYTGGKAAAYFHGAEVGWLAYKVGENICALILTVWTANVLINGIRRRGRRKRFQVQSEQQCLSA